MFSSAIAVAVVAVLVIGGCGGCLALRSAVTNTVTFTVRHLDDQTNCSTHSCKHQYLVFTSAGVFKDTDTIWFFKFNSSDLYNQLQVGHSYKCKSFGWRIPLFSTYKNLISCSEVHPR